MRTQNLRIRFRPDNKKTDVRILFAYTYVKKIGCVFRTYKKRMKNGYCVNPSLAMTILVILLAKLSLVVKM